MREHVSLRSSTGRGRKSLAAILAPVMAVALISPGATVVVAAEGDTVPWPAECIIDNMPSYDPGFPGIFTPPASLVEAAAAEGQLVIYSAISETATMDNIVARFQEAYPGVSVTWTIAGGGSQRRARFLAEAEANQPGADIITDFSRSFFRDTFDKSYTLSLDEVIEGFSTKWPADLLWTSDRGATGVFTFSPFGFAYNTERVPADLAPTSWQDLTDPAFMGHIQIKDVNASANTADHFKFLRATLGEEGFRAFAANLSPTPLHTDAQIMAQELAAGGTWVMPQAQPNVIEAIARTGAPVRSIVPDDVGGSQYAVGVAANAIHPNAAALFAYWTYSPQGQWVHACEMKSGSPVFPDYGPKNFGPYTPATEQELAELNEIMGITP